MYRKILVGFDDSDRGKDAIALGKRLADATGAELVVGGVFQWDPVWHAADARFRDADAEFERSVKDAAEAVGAEPETVASSSPAHGLHELAEKIGADLILVGSGRYGRVGQILAGTTAIPLLHGSPCAVGIAPSGYRERADDEITSVAIGFDGSEESGQALLAASRLAADADARLNLVSVAVPPPMTVGKGGATGWHALLEAIEEQARERLSEAREAVPEGVVVDGTLVSGDPVLALADAGDQPGTVLVIGSRSYGPLRRVLLGSVSTPLVRSAPCPMIVTPRGVRETADAQPVAAMATAS
jgi:nucleotide-binding universal stress UspA family protein